MCNSKMVGGGNLDLYLVIMVMLSTAFFNSGRDEEFFKGRFRGFQRRMVEGKKE